MSEDNELTLEESRALAALAEGTELPPGLEEAVVSRLATRGLISPRRRRWAAWAFAAAAGLALFAAGVTVGARRAAAPAASPVPAMTRYVLFLYDAPGEETLSAPEMADRVDEYRNWAIALREQGSDITGEKLGRESLDLGAAGAARGPEPLGGYFVFSAKDRDAALAVARSCPHLRHGGRAELRPIEET